MAESSMLRRTFRNVAVIAGLIERHHPGAEKTRRQVTVNSDLIYDVLRKHQPDHILLRATRADAAGGLTDLSRIAGMLARVKGRIVHMVLSRVSPLAVPVLLEIGRESVRTRGGRGEAAGRGRGDHRRKATGERRAARRCRRSTGRTPARRSARRAGGLFGTGMTAAPIHLAGERLMLDPAGALFWPAAGLLAVSDLHLEKGRPTPAAASCCRPGIPTPRSTASPCCSAATGPASWSRSATASTTPTARPACPPANWRGCAR